jgi:hypothetical protein
MKTETKILEFGKLEVGKKFYLSKPDSAPLLACYTKIATKKNQDGSWCNAMTPFGTPAFVQYDKRVWVA